MRFATRVDDQFTCASLLSTAATAIWASSPSFKGTSIVTSTPSPSSLTTSLVPLATSSTPLASSVRLAMVAESLAVRVARPASNLFLCLFHLAFLLAFIPAFSLASSQAREAVVATSLLGVRVALCYSEPSSPGPR